MVLRLLSCLTRPNTLAAPLTAVACLGFAHPALAAEGDSYLCKIDTHGPFEGTVPEMVAFVVGTDDGGTMVFDPFINNYYNGPIDAQLLDDNDAKVRIRWVIKFVAVGEVATTKLQYELLFLKGQNKAQLRAKLPYGESKEPTFPATCTREKWE